LDCILSSGRPPLSIVRKDVHDPPLPAFIPALPCHLFYSWRLLLENLLLKRVFSQCTPVGKKTLFSGILGRVPFLPPWLLDLQLDERAFFQSMGAPFKKSLWDSSHSLPSAIPFAGATHHDEWRLDLI